MTSTIQLIGRIFLTFGIETKSGLHIGGSDEGIGIGGVDKTVIRDPITKRPYIPGSSLRGKVRSLTEKYYGLPQNKRIGKISIHTCTKTNDYENCSVCQIYGVPGEEFSTPTRLIVRDIQMSNESVERLNTARTDLPFTEVKTEVAIDRVTSAASPRQMERVPAGVTFGKAEMVYNLYSGAGCDATTDLNRFQTVITGLQLLEDDYLGGLGSRGSGKVALKDIKVEIKTRQNYNARQAVGQTAYDTLDKLVADFDNLKGQIQTAMGIA